MGTQEVSVHVGLWYHRRAEARSWTFTANVISKYTEGNTTIELCPAEIEIDSSSQNSAVKCNLDACNIYLSIFVGEQFSFPIVSHLEETLNQTAIAYEFSFKNNPNSMSRI